jgi:hypothetical protein
MRAGTWQDFEILKTDPAQTAIIEESRSNSRVLLVIGGSVVATLFMAPREPLALLFGPAIGGVFAGFLYLRLGHCRTVVHVEKRTIEIYLRGLFGYSLQHILAFDEVKDVGVEVDTSAWDSDLHEAYAYIRDHRGNIYSLMTAGQLREAEASRIEIEMRHALKRGGWEEARGDAASGNHSRFLHGRV